MIDEEEYDDYYYEEDAESGDHEDYYDDFYSGSADDYDEYMDEREASGDFYEYETKYYYIPYCREHEGELYKLFGLIVIINNLNLSWIIKSSFCKMFFKYLFF